MRKAYTQPKLYAESFELVEHITACTGYTDQIPDLTTARSADAGCSYDYQGIKLFIASGGDHCDTPGGDYDGAEKDWPVFCYNNPDGGLNGNPFGS